MEAESLFSKLPREPVKAVHALCSRVGDFDSGLTNRQRLEQYETYLDILSRFVRFAEHFDLKLAYPGLTPDSLVNINRITEFFHGLKGSIEKNMLRPGRESGKPASEQPVESLFFPGFSIQDHLKAQNLVNDLRQLFKTSRDIDPAQRTKLLKRLEALQRALNRADLPGLSLSDFL
ncbi:hypothetical protein JW906_07670 [bacterium]|nr:hypothetical protein [bacterium]